MGNERVVNLLMCVCSKYCPCCCPPHIPSTRFFLITRKVGETRDPKDRRFACLCLASLVCSPEPGLTQPRNASSCLFTRAGTRLHHIHTCIHPSPTLTMILPPSAAIDLQSNSPLFQLIPQEVRKLIWQHAATAYSNPEVEHRQDSHFFRPPEYTHHKLRSTDWLRTCRLVYREAWDMPGRLNVHAFWADIERSPMEAGVLNKDGLYQAGPFKESDMRYWRFRGEW